jgi:hypothetical protein
MSSIRQASPPPPRRAHPGELVSAGAAVLLATIMFVFAWYGLAGIPGRLAPSGTENAWHALTVIRWLMLLTIVAALGTPFVHASQRAYRPESDPSAAVALLGSVTSVLLAFRVLVEPPTPAAVLDQKLGAYLGLLSSVAIAIGAYESFAARRILAAAARRPPRPVRA